ncbi:MAG: response regulator, partial [Candidatus Solibacter sp.]|nr:response regulator [Candidatus Solibacter sp.]
GVGSAFRFTAEIELPGDGCESDVTAPELHGVRILVVDDNRTNRDLFAELLQAWGARPSLADGSDSATTLLEQAFVEGRPFRFLLLDAGLPGSAAFHLASTARSHPGLAGETVTMMGSRELSQKQEHFRALGVALQLTRPVLPGPLLDALRQALSGEVPSASVSQLTESRPPVAPAQALRILIAEDNLTNQTLITRVLSKWGHEPQIAANGQEAVDLWGREAFDLILMDLEMPVMGGVEATRVIRSRENGPGHHIPIFALTAHVLNNIREQCAQEDMDGYLSKPLRLAELRAAIEGITVQSC